MTVFAPIKQLTFFISQSLGNSVANTGLKLPTTNCKQQLIILETLVAANPHLEKPN